MRTTIKIQKGPEGQTVTDVMTAREGQRPETRTKFNYYLAAKRDNAHKEDPDFAADDRMLDERTTITIVLDSYLTRPAYVIAENPQGFTRKAFAAAVAEGYRAVYKADEATSRRGMVQLNRIGEPAGDFGIWGHCLEDLSLYGARLYADGVWDTEIVS